ncbi:MAG: glycosyltransferase family 4 protein [Geobacteraceae bacterium]|nr:glycosyltransferase family 4 protein [Geobacteraceae bacterium]
MKILLILKKNASLTGAGTYEAVLHRELAKRHRVKVYEGPEDLAVDWDVAHCSDLKHLPLGLARKLRCPLVVDAHDYYWIRYYHFFCLDFPLRFLLQKYRRIKYHFLFGRIDAIILHGRFMYDIYDHPRKYLNFYFGLDYGAIVDKPWTERENLILFVGGDFFRKGLPWLLRAMPLVLARVPGARLLVIGRDHWYARAFARFLSRGLPVEFVYGMPRGEVCKTYSRARALVLPSAIEALSLVSAEATMAGVPPVLSDAGGMPEVVRDGETGFIVPYGDTNLLAERLVSCLTDRELSEQLVRHGREFFGRFTIERMMDRIDEIYRDVIARAAQASGGDNK